jgi:hypothetical protein
MTTSTVKSQEIPMMKKLKTTKKGNTIMTVSVMMEYRVVMNYQRVDMKKK